MACISFAKCLATRVLAARLVLFSALRLCLQVVQYLMTWSRFFAAPSFDWVSYCCQKPGGVKYIYNEVCDGLSRTSLSWMHKTCDMLHSSRKLFIPTRKATTQSPLYLDWFIRNSLFTYFFSWQASTCFTFLCTSAASLSIFSSSFSDRLRPVENNDTSSSRWPASTQLAYFLNMRDTLLERTPHYI